MVTCIKYKATVPESTCIARMDILAKHTQGKNWGYGGRESTCKYDGCSDCDIGGKLYAEFKGQPKKAKVTKNMKTKICSKCGREKPLDQFHKKTASIDGRQPHCKECHMLYYDKKALSKTVKIKSEPLIIPKKAVSDIKLWVCTGCGEEKPLTKDFFHINKNNYTGFTHQCKICRNNAKKKARGTLETCIILDMKKEPDLMEKIEAWAIKERRKPADQILWALENMLNKQI